MTPEIINIIGFVGALVALSSYLARTHQGLCLLVSAGLIILAVHYQLIGASTTAVLCVFSAVRSLVAPWATLQQRRTRMVLTVAGCAIVGILTVITWLDWRSLISMVSTVILILASFHLRDDAFRKALLLVEVLLAINSAVLGSTPGVLLALCGLLLNSWVMIRGRMQLAPLR